MSEQQKQQQQVSVGASASVAFNQRRERPTIFEERVVDGRRVVGRAMTLSQFNAQPAGRSPS